MKIAVTESEDRSTQEIINILQKIGADPNEFFEDFRSKIEDEARAEDPDFEDGSDFRVWIDGEFSNYAYTFTGRCSAFWKRGMRGDYYQPDDPDEVTSWYVTGKLEFFENGDTDDLIGTVELWRWN